MDIKEYLSEKRRQVEEGLENFMLAGHDRLEGHIESMRYSLFAGGKRIRPILCLAAAEVVSGNPQTALPAACSLECIHTYSLIHDDLPAMDDDDFRRGKATNHKMYGEAAAILAGDGLLTFAFQLISDPAINSSPAERQLQVINIIAQAAGPLGMVGGQALDIVSEGKTIPFETLQFIHSHKTGALITASVQAGAVLGGADTEQFSVLTKYGTKIGLTFQIVDDLLNVEGTLEQLGKTAGSDAAREKATYPAFFGVEETRKLALENAEAAVDCLNHFDDKADPLRELALYIVNRKR